MRHGKKHNHLGRKTAHRHAMLSNMATSLILHKRIETTVAKAKALRIYVEPLLTKSKEDNTHNRRVVFSYLKEKEAIKELFGIVAEKIASRPGGYTRIIKLPNRLGDNAEMCMMELVDFNEVMLAASADKPVRTRRSRRGGTTGTVAGVTAKATVATEVVAETTAEVVTETTSEVTETAAEVVEVAEIEATETVAEVTEVAEETLADETATKDTQEAEGEKEDSTKE